jgi:Tol biopolymer transport system component
MPGDSNYLTADVFVHDRLTGQTTWVSKQSGGGHGGSDSIQPNISANGRFVAFTSSGNLTPPDWNAASDVFVHDRQTSQTTRVSVDSGGVQGNGYSSSPAISSDGRFVAFGSRASNLVPGDTNACGDVFVHDRQTGQTTRVSVDSGGIQGNQDLYGSTSISTDGRFVAFGSHASNLVPGDTNGAADVFVHDRQTSQTTRVSVDSGGFQGIWDSSNPSISSDGRLVAFESYAFNLVPGDTNGWSDIFVHDCQTGQTTRVSVDSGGVQGDRFSWTPSISSDGRFVAFISAAGNLVPGDSSSYDIFVHDRHTGQTTLVSVDSGGIHGNASSGSLYNGDRPGISSEGRFIAFWSEASNLVPHDTNGCFDIFVHDRKPIAPTLAAQDSCPGLMTFTLDAATPEGGVAFALGAAGAFTLTSSGCAGTVLDIANPQLSPVIRASWLGTIERAYQMTPAMCGLTVQAVDMHTCKTSNAVVL